VNVAKTTLVRIGVEEKKELLQAVCNPLVSIGDWVYIAGERAGTNVYTDHAKLPAVGVVTRKMTTTECEVQYGGPLTVMTVLVPHHVYFLDVAGQLTDTAPAVGNVQRVGVAFASDVLLIALNLMLVKRN
jgi:hypothetical protein